VAYRTTMQDLERKLRRYIGDPASLKQTWTSQELQDTMDRYRTEVRYGLLRPTPDLGPGGPMSYLVYQAPVGDWEANAQILNSSYNVLTPAQSDYNVGRWTLATNTPPPVFVKGFYYDLNGAAVELLQDKLALLVGNYDVSGQGTSLRRSQVFDHVQALIQQCYSRMKPGRALLTRNDIQVWNEDIDVVLGTNGINIW
jgi:hypothetical protein